MSRILTAEEREDLTPEEVAAIMGDNAGTDTQAEEAAAAEAARAAEEAATKAAADKLAETAPELDEDGEPVVKPEPTAEEVAAAAAAAEAAKAGEKTEPSAEDLAALLEEDGARAPAVPKPITYKGITEDAYKAEASKLNAEKATAMRDLMDGTIDAEAYAAIEAAVADKRDDLVANRTLARANAEAFEQETTRKMADFQTAIGGLMKASALPGAPVNYATDAKAQKEFDNASRLIAEDPDNANLTPQQVCDQANAMVLALRGIVAGAPPAPAPAPAAAAAKTAALTKNPPPTTLGGLPAAAPNAIGADLRAQFNALQGEDAEEFLERLPKAQRQALLSGSAV